MTLDDACDYIILKTTEAGEHINLLKLQKLMYYVQAWHLAFEGSPLFNGRFQAWIHGPVSRDLYDRFRETKSLYSEVTPKDVRDEFNPALLSEQDRLHIDSVLEEYAGLSGTQLEEMTHREAPWIEARKGFRPSERCEVLLDETLMGSYYRRRSEES